MGVPAALGPEDRAANRFAQIIRRRVGRRALVQAHGDVDAEVFLDGDGPLRRQLQQGAVDVGTEDGGAVVDLAALARGCKPESRRYR